jgi:threonine/homoserine/homoserine lactone efflux protein
MVPKIVEVFCWGLLISFLGSLPLGTLNVAAMQIGIQESVYHAMLFSFGSLLVEMIYVRISLLGIDWVRKQARLMRTMEWITLLIIAALAVGSFLAALKEGVDEKNFLLNNNLHRFVLGMMMCAINPVQIPFWFGWSAMLFSKNILQPVNSHYNSYIIGIGLGTLLGNAVFIFGGKWVVSHISGSSNYINWFVGTVFAVTAVIQLVKLLRKKGNIAS